MPIIRPTIAPIAILGMNKPAGTLTHNKFKHGQWIGRHTDRKKYTTKYEKVQQDKATIACDRQILINQSKPLTELDTSQKKTIR
jgi:hypothetical protein